MPSPFKSFASLLMAAIFLFSLIQPANAVTIVRDDPEQLLKQATDELLAISKAARDYAEEDRQRYYREVTGVLDQVIDRDYFARGVMATYASFRFYKTLKTDQEREAFKARVKKFADSLQEVLIEKYADALMVFDGERIDVENVTGGNGDSNKATLLQTIYDKGNTVYRVQYNMQRQKDDRWLINNVIVEGVNLGATYRNQFADAVEKNKGDVDYVVDHWKELMTQQIEKDRQAGAETGAENNNGK